MEKIIHYCWFGSTKKPKKLKKYFKSWKKYLPDYKLMEWNESNFDVNTTDFSKQAYENKKWAFVADVARVYALQQYGGIYFDTDIEVVKNIDSILKNNIWLGREDENFLATAMIGVKEKGNKHLENILNIYKNSNFNVNDLYSVTSPKIFTKYFESLGMKKRK
ncbi:MAG: glycosyltransferase [Clostridia bacterium]|nr:glycosyltransferase [Clostridia bacterium]